MWDLPLVCFCDVFLCVFITNALSVDFRQLFHVHILAMPSQTGFIPFSQPTQI